MNLDFLKSGPPAEYGRNSEYLMDQFFRRDTLNQKVAEAFAKRDFDYYFESIDCGGRAKRLEELSEQLAPEEFWHFVRRFWCQDCHGGWDNERLLIFLQSDRPGREHLMKPHEQEMFAAMPDELTVYRGCQLDGGRPSFSWTLEEVVAAKWARKTAVDRVGRVLRGQCRKRDVLAFFQFGGLNEAEIVILPDCVRNLESRTTVPLGMEDKGEVPWAPYVEQAH